MNEIERDRLADKYRVGGLGARTHLSLVRSEQPFGFLSITATAHGAPRWLLVRGDRAVTDLSAICDHLVDLLGDDPETVAIDDAALAWLSSVLSRAAAAERRLLPRKMQRALDQMARSCRDWATASRRSSDEETAVRWLSLAGAAAGTGSHQPDAYALAEAWLGLVRPRLDAVRRSNRRARYVLLRDIERSLESDPLDIEEVARECSGLLEEVPLAERVRACILGLAGASAPAARPAWGMTRST